MGDDAWDSQLMEIQDLNASYLWSQFVGSTITRVVADFIITPNLPTANPASDISWLAWAHLGIGVTDDDTPEQTQWDPNLPHASFMWRRSSSPFQVHWRQVDNPTEDVFVPIVFGQGDEQTIVRLDTNVKRVLRENDQLWVFAHTFVPAGASFTLDIGYTGRVLIQLH